ncbi:MAG TPA: DUF5712 family protein [Mucilaginibacter sp.]
MYINITNNETGNNQGSSADLVHYLEKENRLAAKQQPDKQPEQWFNNDWANIQSYEVRPAIDNNIAKLGKDEAKFFLINISPSQKELRFLKEKYGENGMEAQLKVYAVKVMDEYALNFKRPGINSSKDLVWFGKLEHYRYYGHKDKEVKEGLKRKGERKEGEQMHIQVIVSRKDKTNKIKLSPQNKSRGRNEKHSKKVGQFDRVAFKASGETVFDQHFDFKRGLHESFRFAKGMKNGTTQEKVNLGNEKETQQEDAIRQHRETTQQIKPDLLQPLQTNYNNLLQILLTPTKDDSTSDPLRRRKRRRKGLDQDLSL